ncbi:MAG: hypothetical protein P9L91_00935 [Candidatus Zophobacter franzmannii]|nr:hypothetical protein [Candidatus Zophobacter franzmannii]
MKKWVTLILALSITLIALAQEYDFTPNTEGPSEVDILMQGDVIKINTSRKDARLAMAMSMLIPGAGNFYADSRSVTSYIWPVLEIGLWAGYIYFRSEGDKATDDYEKYADQNYNRDQQHDIEPILKDKYLHDVYDDTFWRLDDDNTQHFYEDIAKYDKYVFGWNDWYETYAMNAAGEEVTPEFLGDGEAADYHWTGNEVMNGDDTWPSDERYSKLRSEFIQMRADAEDEYDKASLVGFGIILNHMLSAADAVRLTIKHNTENLVANDIKLNYCVTQRNSQLTPFVYLTKRF